MDHNQRHSFPKTFRNSELENLPSNEEDGNVCSLSDLNESESCIRETFEIANNFDLCANDDVANICLESQQYRFGGSEQENIQLIENNTNFSNMNISIENTTFNLVLDSIYILQQGNPLDCCSTNCLLSVPPYTSDDKEIGNYLTTSYIFGSESSASEADIITRGYITKYMSSLTEQNEVESFHSITAISSEEHKEASDVSNNDAIFDNDVCMPKSFKASEKETFLNNTNIQRTSGGTGNCGITRGQKDEDVQSISQNGVEPLKQTIPEAQASDNRSSNFCNRGELLGSVNDIYAVAGASSTNAEVQWHLDGERFVCSICLKVFTRKSSFVYHYRTHTGEKPFACDKCDKTYSQKSYLTNHLRTHTGEKPYVCDKCGKRFNQSDYLAKHYRTHTGEKPYTCSICGKAFSQRSHRNTHYKNVHYEK